MVKRRPKTIEEAVSMLLEDMSREERRDLKAMKETELINCHFGLALRVRNDYGLWENDCPLVERFNIGYHPDSASNKIVHDAWNRLRESELEAE